MAYKKLPGIYRKESPAKHKYATQYENQELTDAQKSHNAGPHPHDSPAKHSVAQGQGMNHKHGLKINIPKVGKSVGKAGKWVGKGINKAWKNRPKIKVRLRGGVRPGKTPF